MKLDTAKRGEQPRWSEDLPGPARTGTQTGPGSSEHVGKKSKSNLNSPLSVKNHWHGPGTAPVRHVELAHYHHHD
eukprot:2360726-Rhodomonas_salina.4